MTLLAHLLLSASTAGNNRTEAKAAWAEWPSTVLASTLQRHERGAGESFITQSPTQPIALADCMQAQCPCQCALKLMLGLCWSFKRALSLAASEDMETLHIPLYIYIYTHHTPQAAVYNSCWKQRHHVIAWYNEVCVCREEFSVTMTKYRIKRMTFNCNFLFLQ